MIRCSCGRPTTEPGRLCAGCGRRTPPVLPPLPPRTGAFVPAPRVQAAPPRRMEALPESAPSTPRVNAYANRSASPDLRARALVAADALVAHYGGDRAASASAGVNASAIGDVRSRRCGPYVCTRLIEAAAKLLRVA